MVISFLSNMCDIIFDQSAHRIFACCQALALWFAIIWSFRSFCVGLFASWSYVLSFKFIIKWREAGLSRYFSTLEEKFCISVQPRNILYKSESQIKAIVISIGRKMLSFVLFLPFLPLVLLLHPKTQGKNIGILLWIPQKNHAEINNLQKALK